MTCLTYKQQVLRRPQLNQQVTVHFQKNVIFPGPLKDSEVVVAVMDTVESMGNWVSAVKQKGLQFQMLRKYK